MIPATAPKQQVAIPVDHTGKPLSQSPTVQYRAGGISSYRTTWGGSYLEGGPLDDLPWFDRTMLEVMRTDPICRLAFDVVKAPFGSAGTLSEPKNPEAGYKGFYVEATSEEVARYVADTISRICTKGVNQIIKPMIYGQSGFEVEYDYDPNRGILEVDSVKGFDIADLMPLLSKKTGRLSGVRVQRVPGYPGPVDLTKGRGCWLINERVDGLFSGISRFLYAYPPFWELWHKGGAVDSRRLKMLSGAHSGMKIGFPDHWFEVRDPDTNELIERVHGGTLAQEAVFNFRNGGAFVYPVIQNAGPDGKPMEWQISPPESHGGAQEILEYPERLVTWIMRGFGIPDNVIQSTMEGGTGTYGGRQISFEAFLWSIQHVWQETLEEISRQVVKWMVYKNFGAKADFAVHATELMPFEEPGQEGEGEGGMGGGDPFGQGGGDEQGFGEEAGSSPSPGEEPQLPGFSMSKWKNHDRVNAELENHEGLRNLEEALGRRVLTCEGISAGVDQYKKEFRKYVEERNSKDSRKMAATVDPYSNVA